MEMISSSADGVVWVTPDLGVADAEWLMLGSHVASAVVHAGGRLVGILRAEDIAARADGAARGMRVADVMRDDAGRFPGGRVPAGPSVRTRAGKAPVDGAPSARPKRHARSSRARTPARTTCHERAVAPTRRERSCVDSRKPSGASRRAAQPEWDGWLGIY